MVGLALAFWLLLREAVKASQIVIAWQRQEKYNMFTKLMNQWKKNQWLGQLSKDDRQNWVLRWKI